MKVYRNEIEQLDAHEAVKARAYCEHLRYKRDKRGEVSHLCEAGGPEKMGHKWPYFQRCAKCKAA